MITRFVSLVFISFFVFAEIFKLVRFKLSTLCCVLGSRSDTVYSMKIKSANIYKVYDMVASAPARTGADIRNSTPCGTLAQYKIVVTIFGERIL